jgi:NADH-quinone oxidoreductase subunit H
LVDIQFSILYSLFISSLGTYGIFLAGWSSNSKYSLLGAIRAISQMISYEISISIIILPVILFSGSFNLITIIYKQVYIWYILPLFPLCIIFLISILAETNRAPFDLAEAEAELVAGYNIEYSSILFVAFFLGEYSNILMMSGLFSIFFLGG